MGKSIITIYIESSVNDRATELGINKSQICNEALKLAVLGLEQTGSQEQTQENAFSNFLNYKIEKEKDKRTLAKAWRSAPISQKNQDIFQKTRKLFSEKYGMGINEVQAILEKEKVAPKEKEGLI